ncbi:MAG: YdcF family protein [Eubacterium sp.]
MYLDNSKKVNDITDFIFVGTEPSQSDAIFVVGGSLPTAAELAAELYHRNLANKIIIGGKFSVKRNSFPLPKYETEYDFYKEILINNGVKESDIYGEKESGYTKQNAEFAKKIVDESNLKISKAIIVCKSFHARRCLLFYQMYFNDVEFTVVTFDGFDISKDNWYKTEYGVERVIGEIQRISTQISPDVTKEFEDILT